MTIESIILAICTILAGVVIGWTLIWLAILAVLAWMYK